MRFVDAYKLLFPKGRAFNSTKSASLASLNRALAKLPQDAMQNLESAYSDIFPEATREVEYWERQFGVNFTKKFTESERRSILRLLWRDASGQSAAALEAVLKLASADIEVVENIPARNPANAQSIYTCACKNKSMVCGYKKAVCGFAIGTPGYLPYVLKNGTAEAYNIPADVNYWQNCFFVCGGVVRAATQQIAYIEIAEVDAKWKDFIEFWVLKSKGAHTTALLFIKYV